MIIRFDPEDLEAGLKVFEKNGRPICHAVFLYPGAFNSIEAAQKHAQAKDAFKRDVKRRNELAKFFKPEEVAALMPSPVREEIPQERVVGLDFSAMAYGAPDPVAERAYSEAFGRRVAAMTGVDNIFDHPGKKKGD